MNITEYNKKCAELLGWSHSNNVYQSKGEFKTSYIEDKNLQFHNNWDWIMMIAEKINILENPIKTEGDTTFWSYRNDMRYSLGKTNKEDVISVINEFLNWYNKQ